MSNQDRPKCVGCGHRLDADEFKLGRLTCTRCEEGVKENLNALAGPDGLFAQLVWQGADALTPGGSRNNSDPAVKTSKTNAPSPVRLQAMNLLGAGGVVQTLQKWVSSWYDDLGFRQPIWRGQHHFVVMVAPGGIKVNRPGQLDNTVRVLLNNLPWAVENRTDFGQFRQDIWGFVEDAKSAVDPTAERPTRVLVGRCPGRVDELVCGAKLLADPFASSIRCANCGTTWSRAKWVELGQTMRSA